MGNAASLLLYAAPILTFKRVITKRSTEEFSCIPYTIALFNCLLYTCFALHDHYHRKLFVGSVALVASIGMYGSPLVAVKTVIKTKSVEFMPFYLSFFSCLSSSLWMAYGCLRHDLFVAAPNILGSPMGLLQIILYCMYKKHKDRPEEPNKMDLENTGVKLGSLELEVHGKI
ncbi:hypothetical protein J5N97_007678 [Dioscorea zingiberensis]|uniref:Uncharacterized protein n=1 Tax=Dioscorea zingiberensis TaxID=325984 RepID=A0A9D5DFS7_9LILI|nr:hypothetical protein J5N97_007678 [Dioscorea zingiberensis]